MLSYPTPTPFSPTQEDLDHLAASLLQSYREQAERERQSTEEKALKDAEARSVRGPKAKGKLRGQAAPYAKRT